MNYLLLEKDTTISELQHQNMELKETVKKLKAKICSLQVKVRSGGQPNSSKDQTFVRTVIACCITFVVVYLLK